jgi:Bacterial extracellular solute-binding protein/von Willebrand factor type A domain
MPGRHAAAPDGGARRRTRAPRSGVTEGTQPPEPREQAGRDPEYPDSGGGGWRRGSLVLAASVIALFSVAGWSALSSFGSSCAGGRSLTVAVAPEIGPVVDAVVSPADGEPLETAQGCSLVVRRADPDKVLAAISAGEHAPDLWIPDTSAWLARLPSSVPEVPPRPVAKTPVVLAGPAGTERPDTWLAAMSEPGSTLLDPTTTGASVGALEALHAEAVKGATSGTALSEWLVSTAPNAPESSLSDSEMLDNASDSLDDAGGWFPTTEQRFIHDAARISLGGLAPTVPRAGTILMDYPLVPVATGDGAKAASAAASLLGDRLASAAAERKLREAGFRPASGLPIDAPGSIGTFTELGVVQPESVTGLLNTWMTLTADARMLTVLDVSASMEDYAGGSTRVALTRDAALAALQDLPSTWQMGLWAFSQGLGPGDSDHLELAAVRELGEESGGTTQREKLTDAVRRLPSLTEGGTGLYDTALAAYRSAASGYDPQRFNGVVLLTDGRNDDDGISLPKLLDALRSERDPARPVPLITIGMGPDADTAALRRMAEATGGHSYVVRDPRDLEAVFDDALLERVGWGLR